MSFKQVWQIEVRHEGLNRYRLVRGTNQHVVAQTAAAQRAIWDEMWARRLATQRKVSARARSARDKVSKKALAAERSKAAQAVIAELTCVLKDGLANQDRFTWELLKDTSKYAVPQPTKATPAKPALVTLPWAKPEATHTKYLPQLGMFDHLIPSRKKAKILEARKRFSDDSARWEQEYKELLRKNEVNQRRYEDEVQRAEADYKARLSHWMQEEEAFANKQKGNNEAIVNRKKDYFAGSADAILEYCDSVLSFSQYPDCLPRDSELDYDPDAKMMVVDYSLPSPDDLPQLKEVKYVQARDEFVDVSLSQSELNRMYDSLLYQLALRVSHELYDHDIIEAIHSIVFNGWVRFVDKATGNNETACILSLHTDRAEFLLINLSNVDPKACFRSLKGVGSSKLSSLVSVPPILAIDKDDRRFVPSYQVADTIDERSNLAAMDWEDFENLIRELFEKEFAQSGGEVKVTQASRDGGVDAVAFDPDPIRGGKIVIQAKRYTNVVGVSAVRDLYGTVMNEGATKGILVTTATFGPDAYQFANGKPLTLLNGGNLLHLLEKHGHKAKIDLKEAKRLIAEKDAEKPRNH